MRYALIFGSVNPLILAELPKVVLATARNADRLTPIKEAIEADGALMAYAGEISAEEVILTPLIVGVSDDAVVIGDRLVEAGSIYTILP